VWLALTLSLKRRAAAAVANDALTANEKERKKMEKKKISQGETFSRILIVDAIKLLCRAGKNVCQI
jgi:hypothetical protein